MFDQHMTQAQVAGHLEVSSMTASRWYRAWKEGGTTALLSKGTYGAVGKLTAQQRARLQTELDQGAVAHGWPEDRWTLKRIGTLITRLFTVTYTEAGVWYLMERLGWSCQRPATRPLSRDEQDIGGWRDRTWSRVKPPRRSAGPGSASPTRRDRACALRGHAPGGGGATPR